VYQGEQILDSLSRSIGLRSFAVDSLGRFLLNGEIYKLKGVGFHEDWPASGPAISLQQRATDISLVVDMGANAIRLAHYPHSRETLELADKAGLIVWSEIPFVGSPFGPALGFTKGEEFRRNSRRQLIEMISQQYNHPSVAFWGIFNEMPRDVDNDFEPLPLIRELNSLAKNLDPSRLTASASAGFAGEATELLGITDTQFWNRYFGWYHGEPSDLGKWLDETREVFDGKGIGVSEYGAGASTVGYQEKLVKPYGHGAPIHPENWQSHLHSQAWLELEHRDFILGSFVWSMFDFSSSLRKEGGHDGLNTKGLISYDREVKKDAYYFYKANWAKTPTLYIADRRSVGRTTGTATIRVFSNAPKVELSNNGVFLGARKGVNGVFEWQDVDIESGNNLLLASAEIGGELHSDKVVWHYSDKAALVFRMIPIFAERTWVLLIMGVLLILFFAWRGDNSLARLGASISLVGFWGVAVFACIYILCLAVLQATGLLIGFN